MNVNMTYEIMIFIIVMSVAALFIFYLIGIITPVFVPITANVFQGTANTVANSGTAFAQAAVVGVLIMLIIVGAAVDLYSAVKDPNLAQGLVSILLLFVAVALWLVANRTILNTALLTALNGTGSPLQALFSSTWYITAVGIVLLVSGALHLGGRGRDYGT